MCFTAHEPGKAQAHGLVTWNQLDGWCGADFCRDGEVSRATGTGSNAGSTPVTSTSVYDYNAFHDV